MLDAMPRGTRTAYVARCLRHANEDWQAAWGLLETKGLLQAFLIHLRPLRAVSLQIRSRGAADLAAALPDDAGRCGAATRGLTWGLTEHVLKCPSTSRAVVALLRELDAGGNALRERIGQYDEALLAIAAPGETA